MLQCYTNLTRRLSLSSMWLNLLRSFMSLSIIFRGIWGSIDSLGRNAPRGSFLNFFMLLSPLSVSCGKGVWKPSKYIIGALKVFNGFFTRLFKKRVGRKEGARRKEFLGQGVLKLLKVNGFLVFLKPLGNIFHGPQSQLPGRHTNKSLSSRYSDNWKLAVAITISAKWPR